MVLDHPMHAKRWLTTIGIVAIAAVPMSLRAAGAAPAPDSTRLAVLRSAAAEWNAFRVVTRRARYDVRAFNADAFGIVVRQTEGRAALVTPTEFSDRPQRVAWTEIESVAGKKASFSKSHTVEGVIVGGLVGLAAAGLVIAATGLETAHSEQSAALVGFLPAGMLLGGILGATVGNSTRWHSLYP